MTELQKEYFTEKEIAEDIADILEHYDGYYADLVNEVFNTDYYIIGTHEAKQALEQYGVFSAIDEIKQYEQNNFGQVFTDFSNPEKVANMLYLIKGEEFLFNELEFSCILDEAVEDLETEEQDLWNSYATPEVNAYITRKISAYMEDKSNEKI